MNKYVLQWPTLGFTWSESDHALFYYGGIQEAVSKVRIRCLIGWHVDDGMATLNSQPFLEKVKKRISGRFGIKDLGPVSKYLGVQFEQDRAAHKIWMHQSEYITFLLQEYNLADCSLVRLPADLNAPLDDPSGQYPEVTNLCSVYLKIVGELIYLSVNTHPNISYIVNALAQHNVNPKPRHFASAK